MTDKMIRLSDALERFPDGRQPWPPHAIRKALAALPAVSPEGRVKPLEWFEVERGNNGYGKWTAEGYTVRKIEGLFLLDFAGNGKNTWRFITSDDAKAAAQADYERRILAALEPAEAGGVDLSSPVAVHMNMLRGTIAKPTVEQIIHLYGFDALLTALRPQIMAELGTPLDQVVTAEAGGVDGRPDAPCHIVEYTNWRGETARRTIIPIRMWWGETEWHPQEQWMLTAWDVEKEATRDFAWQDIKPVQNGATSAAVAAQRATPTPVDALVKAAYPDQFLEIAERLIRMEASRDREQKVIDALRYIAIALAAYRGEPQ